MKTINIIKKIIDTPDTPIKKSYDYITYDYKITTQGS